MANETYNGWTNYATWKINLEFDLSNYACNSGFENADELSTMMKDYVTKMFKLDCDNEKTLRYELEFIDEVNFYEIAESIIENMEE